MDKDKNISFEFYAKYLECVTDKFWNDQSFSSQRPICLLKRKLFNETRETWKSFINLETNKSLKNNKRYSLDLLDESFNNFNYQDYELVYFLYKIFTHPFLTLGESLSSLCNIDVKKIECWLFIVYQNYHNVPFHNFGHAFTVTKTMYHLIKITDVFMIVSPCDIFALLFSALCHDIDHPGFNNLFQINTRSKLAMIYNDVSPLENHHCYISMSLLEYDNQLKLTENFTLAQMERFRRIVICCILSTDMIHHKETLDSFQKSFEELSKVINMEDRPQTERIRIFKDHFERNPDDAYILFRMLIKTSDISNEGQGDEVANLWCDRLFNEYFTQAKYEKDNNLPVTSFMNPDLVKKNASQIFFIESLLLPIFQKLASLFPKISETYIANAQRHLEMYSKRQEIENIEESDSVKQDSQKILFKCENDRPSRLSIACSLSLHTDGDLELFSRTLPNKKNSPLQKRRHSSIIGRCTTTTPPMQPGSSSLTKNNQVFFHPSNTKSSNIFKKKLSTPLDKYQIPECTLEKSSLEEFSKISFQQTPKNMNNFKNLIHNGIDKSPTSLIQIQNKNIEKSLRKSSTGSILLSDS